MKNKLILLLPILPVTLVTGAISLRGVGTNRELAETTEGDYYFIKSQIRRNQDWCITAVAGTKEFGSLGFRRCDFVKAPANQKFRRLSDNKFHSMLDFDLCLTVGHSHSDSMFDGVRIRLANCDNSLTTFSYDGVGQYIKPMSTTKDLCLTNRGPNPNKGDTIHAKACRDRADYKWILMPYLKEKCTNEAGVFVWVTGEDGVLTKMTVQGQTVFRTEFSQGKAVGVDPRDGSAWVSDIESETQDQQVKVDACGQELLRVDNLRGEVLGVDPNDGSVWIGLPNEDQVVKLDSDGNELLRVSGFGAPWAGAVDDTGSIWVADGGGFDRKLVKLTSSGEVSFQVATPQGFFSNGPQQVAIDDNDGSVWYVNAHGDSIVKRSTTGTKLAESFGFDRPLAVSVDQQDGSVWAVSSYTNELVKLDRNGAQLFRMMYNVKPTSVSVHPSDGTVWVGLKDNTLIRLTPEGTELMRTVIAGGSPPSPSANPTVSDIVTLEVKN